MSAYRLLFFPIGELVGLIRFILLFVMRLIHKIFDLVLDTSDSPAC